MASDIDKGNFGDSSRNTPHELKLKKSNHVFDGAGENVQYYSDSESEALRKSKTRYINPAIYIEPVESSRSVTSLQAESCISEVTPHPHSTYRSNSTPLLSGRDSHTSSGSVKRKACRLEGLENLQDSAIQQETPRFGCTYREDGPDTFRLSVVSVSTTTTAKDEMERNEKKKQEAFKQWVARKDQEKREKARLEKMKGGRGEPSTSQQQREESYRQWLERKRTQTERSRADEIMQQFQRKKQMERERLERERAKEEKLADWFRRKEEEMKAMKTREERRAAQNAIDEKRRRTDGERAYRDWLRTSKNKPLPVPLNQGELSMRGSVSQMYINPIPWQSPT